MAKVKGIDLAERKHRQFARRLAANLKREADKVGFALVRRIIVMHRSKPKVGPSGTMRRSGNLQGLYTHDPQIISGGVRLRVGFLGEGDAKLRAYALRWEGQEAGIEGRPPGGALRHEFEWGRDLFRDGNKRAMAATSQAVA